MSFKTGQKVVCIRKKPWTWDNDAEDATTGPSYKEEVTVHKPEENGLIYIKEYLYDANATTRDKSCTFTSIYFRAIEDNYATDTLKDIRILQLEDEIKELRELHKLEPMTNERRK